MSKRTPSGASAKPSPDGRGQIEMPFVAPTVVFPAIRIPQPDGGVLIRPGKAVVLEDDVWASEAARILGLSSRRVQAQCQEGLFKTAYKPGGTPRSRWKISRAEVLARKLCVSDPTHSAQHLE